MSFKEYSATRLFLLLQSSRSMDGLSTSFFSYHRKNQMRLLKFYRDDDIDIEELFKWDVSETPSPSSPPSLGALQESKHGRSVATGQPAEKPTGTAPNPCEAASA